MAGGGSSFLLKSGAKASVVTLEQFGAGASGTDMTSAFAAFNAWAVAHSGPIVLAMVAGKLYSAQNAYWTFGIADLTVNANGATFRDLTINGNDYSAFTTSPGSEILSPGSPVQRPASYLLASAAVGATQIQFLTAAEAGNISVGQRLLLTSGQVRFVNNWPLDTTSFNYVTATGVNAGTGIVTITPALTEPLQSNAIWYAIPGHPEALDGRARCNPLVQWDVDQTFNDLFIESDSVAPYFTYAKGEAITFSGGGFAGDSGAPTQAGEVTYDGFHMPRNEIDISITKVTLKDMVDVEYSRGGNACREQVWDNVTFIGGALPNLMLSRTSTILGGHVEGELKIGEGNGWIDTFTATGADFASDSQPESSVESGGVGRVVFGTDGVTYSGGILTVPLAAMGSDAKTFISRVYIGRRIDMMQLVDGQAYRSRGYSGLITAATGDGTNAYITVSFVDDVTGGAYAPVSTDIFGMGCEPGATAISDCTVDGVAIQDRVYVTECHSVYDATIDLTSAMTPAVVKYTRGRLTRVEVQVLRAYTGSTGGNINLELKSNFPGAFQSTLNKIIDLRTTGTRISTLVANSGWTGTGGESSGSNLPGAFLSQLHSAVSTMAGSGSELPQVRVILNFDHPFN